MAPFSSRPRPVRAFLTARGSAVTRFLPFLVSALVAYHAVTVLGAPCAHITADTVNEGPCQCGATPCEPVENLVDKGGVTACNAASPCRECEGGCRDNAGCEGDLMCWFRSSSDSLVPGCHRGGSGDKGEFSYCYSPTTPQQGLYCLEDESRCSNMAVPRCRSEDGALVNEAIACTCGDTECTEMTGLYCNAPLSACSATPPPCAVIDGSAPNEHACTCESRSCDATTGLFCFASSSTCSKVPQCSVTDNSEANTGECVCGIGNSCDAAVTGLYCNASAPNQNMRCSKGAPCTSISGESPNIRDCVCGASHCVADVTGLFCYSAYSQCSTASVEYIFAVRTSGTCIDMPGYKPVKSRAACESGATQVGWATTLMSEVPDLAPTGCFYQGGTLVGFQGLSNAELCSSDYTCLCAFDMFPCPHNRGMAENEGSTCICGVGASAVCTSSESVGMYCYSRLSQCRKGPALFELSSRSFVGPICAHEDGLTPNSADCLCGESSVCTGKNGLVCSVSSANVGGSCTHAFNSCASYDGVTANAVSCQCGKRQDCASSTTPFCYARESKCRQYARCASVDGSSANPGNATCRCGNVDCGSTKRWCYAKRNYCSADAPWSIGILKNTSGEHCADEDHYRDPVDESECFSVAIGLGMGALRYITSATPPNLRPPCMYGRDGSLTGVFWFGASGNGGSCSSERPCFCASKAGICVHTAGIASNPASCTCGLATCAPNNFCYADGDLCSTDPIAVCSIADGTRANAGAFCQCGTVTCNSSSGMYCLSSSDGNVQTSFKAVHSCRPACPAGRFVSKTDSATCQPCTVRGFYCPGGGTLSPTSFPCPSGRYGGRAPLGAVSQCQSCPAGQYQREPGLTYCKQCSTGLYQNESAQSTCARCQDGKVSALDTSFCLACPKGKHASSDQSICLPCVPGKYQDKEGMNRCKVCESGRFQGKQGTVACRSPAAGALVIAGGFVSIAVPLGSFIRESSFHSCPSGWIGTAPPSKVPGCTPCESGETNSPGSMECHSCPKGKFGNMNAADGSQVCEDCTPGTFQPQDVNPSTSCLVCPAGFLQTEKGQSFCLQPEGQQAQHDSPNVSSSSKSSESEQEGDKASGADKTDNCREDEWRWMYMAVGIGNILVLASILGFCVWSKLMRVRGRMHGDTNDGGAGVEMAARVDLRSGTGNLERIVVSGSNPMLMGKGHAKMQPEEEGDKLAVEVGAEAKDRAGVGTNNKAEAKATGTDQTNASGHDLAQKHWTQLRQVSHGVLAFKSNGRRIKRLSKVMKGRQASVVKNGDEQQQALDLVYDRGRLSATRTFKPKAEK